MVGVVVRVRVIRTPHGWRKVGRRVGRLFGGRVDAVLGGRVGVVLAQCWARVGVVLA